MFSDFSICPVGENAVRKITPMTITMIPTHWSTTIGSLKIKMAKSVGSMILIAVKLGTTTTASAFRKPKFVIMSVAAANPTIMKTKYP